MSTPDQIRADIERTRLELSSNVDALGDKVSPSHVAHRQVDRAKGAVTGVKDRVMGSAADLSSGVADKTSSATGSVTDTLSASPDAARRQTRGNPLAAGLIALGAGWLVGSLIPASSREREAATAVKDNAMQLKEPLTEVAKDAASHLQEPAQQAVEAVKSEAADAVQNVKDQGAEATSQVQDEAQQAKETVQSSRS
jgi:gas vesicle protein